MSGWGKEQRASSVREKKTGSKIEAPSPAPSPPKQQRLHHHRRCLDVSIHSTVPDFEKKFKVRLAGLTELVRQ